jgi:hypothetical protein
LKPSYWAGQISTPPSLAFNAPLLTKSLFSDKPSALVVSHVAKARAKTCNKSTFTSVQHMTTKRAIMGEGFGEAKHGDAGRDIVPGQHRFSRKKGTALRAAVELAAEIAVDLERLL